MTDKCFVDTNIFLYAHDSLTGAKHQRALQLIDGLWASGHGVVSTQVLQELSINLQRKTAHTLPLEEIEDIIREYSEWQVITNTPKSILGAIRVQTRYHISFWDALILQAALDAGVSILYSEDLAHGQHYGAVQVVNPLLEPVPE